MNENTHILIVEDEKQIARFLQMELEHEGYECGIEYNGAAALDRIGQEHFDLILLDIMLPDVDGLTICKRTRELSNVPIMMLSAKDDIETKVVSLDIGAVRITERFLRTEPPTAEEQEAARAYIGELIDGAGVDFAALASAIDAVSKAGGGRVLIPAGRWLTGPVHLRSHIDLHLAEGSGHHGVNWVGYVTITAEDRDQLATASRELAELCANEVGIQKLEWLDSYQPAASGATWPIGRGIRPHTPTFGARIMRTLAGGGDKEAIA